MESKIIGGSMQALSIALGENEVVYGDSGRLISKSDNIKMTPKLVGGLFGAITRKVTGATGMLTEFKSTTGFGNVSMSGTMPGKIKEIDLGDSEEFIAEHYAFLAAENTVKFSMETLNFGAAFFGGSGLVLQKFTGPGKVFIHVTGDIIEYELDGSSSMEIDPGHIAGFDATLSYKVTFVDNIKTAMFGGVGLFLAKFTGKGRLMLHSVSRYKLSSEIFLQGEEAAKNKG
ncbi:MAG: TIGR00266 family protein [Candidatus Marsarchaeota archaeon]|nr:TIGR00266 family protein [Candidatus Marsarchaeota archaeon]